MRSHDFSEARVRNLCCCSKTTDGVRRSQKVFRDASAIEFHYELPLPLDVRILQISAPVGINLLGVIPVGILP